jgi:hypothetical protein
VPDVESSDAVSTGMTMREFHHGSCLAEFAFAIPNASGGDFVQGILTRDQYEIIET